MSIRADILGAKHAYDTHLAEHKCGQLTKCSIRAEFWRAWMGVAGMWGQEYDDDQRQRDHYREVHG